MEISPLVERGKREERAATLSNIELRTADDHVLKFEGRAAVFDEWTEIHDMFGSFEERVQRGAFRKVLQNADVRFRSLDHDGLPLARTASGTMTLRESAKGLEVSADLDQRQHVANDLAIAIERGDVSQMSFAFRVGKDIWEHDEDSDTAKRTIVEFSDLFDVSPVTFPAYEGTTAGMRACGMTLADDSGEVDSERLWTLANKIFAGDITPSQEERGVIDAAFSRINIVSPWMAEQAARAYAQEPQLRAALQGRGVTMDITEAPSGASDNVSLDAARARLRIAELAA